MCLVWQQQKIHFCLVDSDLTFDKHISFICNNKVGKKINVLSRLVNYMSFDKCRMVLNAFIESQFNYCPLIRVFHPRTLKNKINRLHERALGGNVYFDYKSSFCKLLEKDKSFSIHHKNIQEFNHRSQSIPYDLRKCTVL